MTATPKSFKHGELWEILMHSIKISGPASDNAASENFVSKSSVPSET